MDIRRMFFIMMITVSDFWSSLRLRARLRHFWKGWKPDNWEDETEPKVPKKRRRKVIKEGRKRTFLRRLGFFALVIIIFSILGLFVGVFENKFLVKLALAFIAGWHLLYKPFFKEGYSNRRKIASVGFWLIFMVGVAYLDYFINLFQLTVLGVIMLASSVFGAEEKTGKNLYPRWVMYTGLIIMVIFVGLTIRDIFQPHEYYVSRQRVSVTDLEQNRKSAAELRAKLTPVDIPGLRERFSDKEAGCQSETWDLVKKWASTSFNIHQLAWLDRIILTTKRIFLVAYTFISLILFFLIAAPDVLSEWMRTFQGKKREAVTREKGKGKDGTFYENILIIKGAWEFLTDFISVWHKKGGKKI